MLEELQSLYSESGIWGQLILVADIGLVIVGIIMLYTVKRVITFFLYFLIALLPILLGLFGYLQFSAEVSEMVEKGLDANVIEQIEENADKPLILGAIAVVVPLALGFVGLRKVRKSTIPLTESR